jgi:murein DD-endopeptidase MepM/ murein hydrolase activator NlpD
MSVLRSWFGVTAVFFTAVVMGSAGTIGYLLADSRAVMTDNHELAAVRADLSEQRAALEEMRASANEHIDALALRMGDLNASVIRLNALGSRLTGMAKLDDGEFDFDSPPAMGGPVDADLELDAGAGQLPDLLADLDTLDATLDRQEQQLAALEGLMLNRKLSERVSPSGRPVKTGWLSSYFGRRSDPMNGKSAYHRGVDFAGKRGAEVIAVGDGVVTYSGDRYGFGNMVEIKHGNGYVTRYAHNQANMVAVGDRVEQGQTIALLGSTGRSTGPHVHFEVWRNGKAVDPLQFIRSK